MYYIAEVVYRYGCFAGILHDIEKYEGGIEKFTRAYESFGLNVRADGSVFCCEWAPGAEGIYLTGDFNKWNRLSHPFEKKPFGKWELVIPPHSDGNCAIDHGSIVKVWKIEVPMLIFIKHLNQLSYS